MHMIISKSYSIPVRSNLDYGPIIGSIISVIFFATKYDLTEEKIEKLKIEFQTTK